MSDLKPGNRATGMNTEMRLDNQVTGVSEWISAMVQF